MTRVSRNYYPTSPSPQPTYDWLQRGDGGELQCPTAMQASWQTIGAQQYPGSPLKIDQPTYEQRIATHHAIDTTTGTDPITIVAPMSERSC